MIDPTHLPSQQTACPKDCPFRTDFGYVPDYLSIYCAKFEQFLGIDKDKQTRRGAECRKIKESCIATGLGFIEAFTSVRISITDTREAFLAQNKSFQKMYVEIIKKTGRQIGITPGDQATPQMLSEELIKSLYEIWKGLDSQEFQEFKQALENEGGVFGDVQLSKTEKTLLQNLFQVLDNSERSILNNTLSLSGLNKAFAKEFKSMPKHDNLLKDMRRVLYEYDAKLRNPEENDKKRTRTVIENEKRQYQDLKNFQRQDELVKKKEEQKIKKLVPMIRVAKQQEKSTR